MRGLTSAIVSRVSTNNADPQVIAKRRAEAEKAKAEKKPAKEPAATDA